MREPPEPALLDLRGVLGEVGRRAERVVEEGRHEDQPHGELDARAPDAQQHLGRGSRRLDIEKRRARRGVDGGEASSFGALQCW